MPVIRRFRCDRCKTESEETENEELPRRWWYIHIDERDGREIIEDQHEFYLCAECTSKLGYWIDEYDPDSSLRESAIKGYDEYEHTGVLVGIGNLCELKKLWATIHERIFGVTREYIFERAEKVNKARVDFHELLNRIAVDRGLPVPSKDKDGDLIHYGIDFIDGEILAVVDKGQYVKTESEEKE